LAHRLNNLKSREMGLGSARGISLAEAREKAAARRQLLANRVDPIDARVSDRAREAVEAAKAITFAQCAERFITAHEAGWKNDKHIAEWRTSLKTYCEPVFGATEVLNVNTELVLKALEPIWTTQAGDSDADPVARGACARLGESSRPPRRRKSSPLARSSGQASALALSAALVAANAAASA
jgi:hypothetical protein